MKILQKVLWLLITSIVALNATDLNQTQVCQAKDGIQTRTDSSKIKFINNPDNKLKANNSSSKTRTIKVQEKINKVEKLTLTAEKTNFIRRKEPYSNRYVRMSEPVKVMATYEDGHSEEVTDNVIWSGENYGKAIKVIGNQLAIGKPKNTSITLMASLGTVNSNILEIDIVNEEDKLLNVEIFNKDKKRFPNRDAGIILSLMHKPTSEVKLRLTLKESDGVKFYDAGRSRELTLTKELIFIPNNPRQEGYFNIVDQDVNNSKPYTIITEVLESEDLRYAGENPKDIVVTPSELKLIAPPITAIRGAIRGVTIQFRVTSKNMNLKYKLINPPAGMEIIGRSDLGEFAIGYIDGVDIKWNVPMDIEEKTYTITTEATDIDGSTVEVSFDIKVPKTNLIETKIVNNELIVTDKNSNLYGMKMKGHSGEDISELRLRSVAYEDVWKHYTKALDVNKDIEHIVFIIDNMPKFTDIKFPSYMDVFQKRVSLGAGFDVYFNNCLAGDCWDWRNGNSYLYEDTNGVTFSKEYQSNLNSSEVFIFTINEKL